MSDEHIERPVSPPGQPEEPVFPALEPLLMKMYSVTNIMDECDETYPRIIRKMIDKHGTNGNLRLIGKYAWPITIILDKSNPYEIIKGLEKYQAIKPKWLKIIDGVICATGSNRFTNLIYKDMPVHSTSYSRIVKFLLIMYERNSYWKLMDALDEMDKTIKNSLRDIPNKRRSIKKR